MRVVLVLDLDPAADSDVRRAVEAGLAAGAHDVHTIDLRSGAFDPAMSTEARRAYHSSQPLIDPDATEFGARVRATEALVFAYRAGWTGIPTRMKGFVDRTFVPGVGFHLVDDKLERGLTHIRRLAAVVVHERPRRQVRRSRDPGRRTALRTFRMIVHPRARRRFVALYSGSPKRTEAARARFVTRAERAMTRL